MRRVYFAILVVLSGCATLVKVPESPVVEGALNPEQGWADLLTRHVDEKGRVDFVKISKEQGPLNAYVNYISRVSPKTTPDKFPTRDSQLAFYLNSYNALSLFNILEGGIPESLSGLRKVKYFYFRKFIIGGEEMSLYDYENKIIRKQGEDRVHFALNCMSAGCPRLPRYPFPSENLQAELEKQGSYFFSEERNLQVDNQKKLVRVSEILKFFTEDFLKKEPTLISYINRYATTKIPEDYEIEFIPYEWTINAVPKKIAKTKRHHRFRYSKWETRFGVR